MVIIYDNTLNFATAKTFPVSEVIAWRSFEYATLFRGVAYY